MIVRGVTEQMRTVAVGSFKPLRMSCDAMRSISWLKKVKVPKTQKQIVILFIFESELSDVQPASRWKILLRRFKRRQTVWSCSKPVDKSDTRLGVTNLGIFLSSHLQNKDMRTSCALVNYHAIEISSS